MKRAGALATVTIAMGAAWASSPEGQRDHEIVGGSPAPGDTAVVAVVARRQQCDDQPFLVCTGVLVSPRVVVTAAHCVRVDGDVGGFEVLFGASLDDPTGRWIVTSDSRVDPRFVDATNTHDVAVLRLADVAPVAPLAISAAALDASAVGVPARAVGYGAAMTGGISDGVRRQGTMTIAEVGPDTFRATPAPGMSCGGDSGGPVFVDRGSGEELVGLTVSGDADCTAYSINGRLDVALADFIVPYVQASATAPLGSSPTASVALEALCESPCVADADCPDLLQCREVPERGPRCVVPGSQLGDLGNDCTTSAECGALARCQRVGPTVCRCSDPCQPSSGGCAAAGTDGGSWLVIVLLVALLLATQGRRRRTSRWP